MQRSFFPFFFFTHYQQILFQRYDFAVIYNPLICSLLFALLFILAQRSLRKFLCIRKKDYYVSQFSDLLLLQRGRATCVSYQQAMFVVCKFYINLQGLQRLFVNPCVPQETLQTIAIDELELLA